MKLAALLACLLTLTLAARAAVQSDIEYGTAAGESLRLDACVPAGDGPFPAVILVHGGAWSAGDKSGGPSKGYMAPLHDPLTANGIAWFSINYRLAPKHPYPACIEDVETAIRWVKAHAAEFHVDPKRIAIAGESAGAHLVALAATRADDRTRVAAVVAFYGPFDLVGRYPHGAALGRTMAELIGRDSFDEKSAEILRSASPIHGIKPGLPPFLLLHGTSDSRVSLDQSLQFQQRLQQAQVPVELIKIKGGNHGMRSWDNLAPQYKQQVVDWLKRTLVR
ncbi:alpha/beta hydrolase [Opitutus sp. ER46]|uniref:alpha/beta hydrolase n=1 Tax=Opitutus sp. ER46 TaxID=2161864 RepID=UPI000D2FEC89|nr:alpha/beta hydrolase [Opitutus sp. ER46]PTX98507.1 hypothetical protein DB354_04385 [Opitutus sp. ER46]